MSVRVSSSWAAMSSVVDGPDAGLRCNSHKKRFKFFCLKHELLLCSICAVKQHRACCDVLTVSEAADDKVKEGNKILDSYAQSIALVENAAAERKAAKKALETNVQEIQNEIHELTEKLLNVLKQEERALIESVKEKVKLEAETLDHDIEDLESVHSNLRRKHETLEESLKASEIGVIYAVLKEKERLDKRDYIDSVVKKTFRDANFKFMASPHVTSFVRHFKSLGQVLLSDDGMTSPQTASVASSIAASSEVSLNIPDSSPSDDNYTGFPKQNRMREIENWQHNGIRHNKPNRAEPDTTAKNEPIHRRRNLPMRALPHPDNPQIYLTPRTQATQRREHIQRPMSTPPVSENMIHPSSKSKDIDLCTGNYPNNFTSSRMRGSSPTPYRTVQRATRPVYDKYVHQDGRRAPSPYDFVASERPMSPLREAQPSNPPRNNLCSVITVKEDGLGRSFAAVQIAQAPEQVHRTGIRAGWSLAGNKYDFSDSHALNETGTFVPSSDPEYHDRRWVHKSSFKSHRNETKKLISGLTLLNDMRIVLVDQESYAVELYDADWHFIADLKLNSRPFDIIVDDGNRVAISLQSERVVKFALVTEMGLMSVADLSVPCDTVCYGLCRGGDYYCVCCGDEIWILSSDGRVIRNLKFDRFGKDLFSQAEYVTINRKRGVLFVSDSAKNTVMSLTVEGQRLWEFAYEGFRPASVKFFKEGLYVCDQDQHRILMLDCDGQVLKQSVIGRLDNPRAISFNDAGDTMLVSQMRYDEKSSPSRPAHVYVLE